MKRILQKQKKKLKLLLYLHLVCYSCGAVYLTQFIFNKRTVKFALLLAVIAARRQV